MAYECNVPFIDFTNQESVENVDVDEFFFGKLENLKIEDSPERANEGDLGVNLNNGTNDLVEEEQTNRKDETERNLENLITKDSSEGEDEWVHNVNETPGEDDLTEGEQTYDVDEKKKIRQVLRERNVQNEENVKKRKSDAHMADNPIKYISLAEGVDKYPNHLTKREPFGGSVLDTYVIFTSASRGTESRVFVFPGYHKKRAKGCQVTVPQSPMLLTKTRHRPVNYPNAEEREEQLVQEINSFKLKANPLNEKIFKTPKLGARVIPKKPTVVQPFLLTEFKKKDLVSKDPKSPYVFKASKIPEGVLQHPVGIPDKALIPCTKPQTPSFLRNEKYKRQIQVLEEVDGKNVYVAKDIFSIGVTKREAQLPKTEVKPFSFEERDQLLRKQKEEKLKKIIEEEKKAREFHAQPLPLYLKSKMNSLCSSPTGSRASNSSIKSLDDPETFQFKARPADVVHKKPFVPKKPECKPLEPLPIELQTEVRAKERKRFDDELKKELEKREQYLLERKEEEARKEEEEVARLRKETVHKASKIRHYKPVPEMAKKSLTDAASPLLCTKKAL